MLLVALSCPVADNTLYAFLMRACVFAVRKTQPAATRYVAMRRLRLLAATVTGQLTLLVRQVAAEIAVRLCSRILVALNAAVVSVISSILT